MNFNKLSKKALKCMYVKTWIASVIWIVIFITGNILFRKDIPMILQGVVYGLVAIIIIYSVFAPRIRYERYRYLLSEEEFAVRKGLIEIKTEIVPIERLHKIEVSSGPIFRMFGLKEIKVTTAGGEINVAFLDDEVADQVAEHLKRRINTIAVEERNVMDTEEENGAE